jgi:hypothetical protein
VGEKTLVSFTISKATATDFIFPLCQLLIAYLAFASCGVFNFLPFNHLVF